jgi:hypothetical protein
MLESLYLSLLACAEWLVQFCSPILGYLTVFVLGLLLGSRRRGSRRRFLGLF